MRATSYHGVRGSSRSHGSPRWPRGDWRRRLGLAALAAIVGCADGGGEAVQGLEATEVAAYWAIRGTVGGESYIRPVVRFRVRNAGPTEVGYIQAMAVFRRESAMDESWGSGYEYSVSSEPLQPGEASDLITLRGDANYVSKSEPEAMFENEEWEQVFVEIFLRAGASNWMPKTQVEVPKRLGAPGVEKFLEPPLETPPDGSGS